MNDPTRKLALLAVLLMLFPVPAAAKGRFVKGYLEHGGLKRSYRLRVPAAYNGEEPVPLVLVLHGGGGRGRSMVRLSDFHEVADREGFLAVFPDGYKKNWNDGRRIDDYPAHRKNVDDVGYLRKLIDTLSEEWRIDPERIYATGASNGGMMTLRLACEMTDLLAAAAPVIASMPEDLAAGCVPSRPLPLLMINGTDDPLVPYEGGQVRFGRRRLGAVRSVPETLSFWVRNNGCRGPASVFTMPDEEPGDKTIIVRYSYGVCDEASEVTLYEVRGGGHTWPGGRQYAPRTIIGRTSRDMDAGDVIWDFFSRFQR